MLRTLAVSDLVSYLEGELSAPVHPETGTATIALPCVVVRIAQDEPIDGLTGCSVRELQVEIIAMTRAERDADSIADSLALADAIRAATDSGTDVAAALTSLAVSEWAYMGDDQGPEEKRWQHTFRFLLVACEAAPGD